MSTLKYDIITTHSEYFQNFVNIRIPDSTSVKLFDYGVLLLGNETSFISQK